MYMENKEIQPDVLIKFTDAELNNIIMALNCLVTMRVPVYEQEWKKPYKTLISDLNRIKEQLNEKKHEQMALSSSSSHLSECENCES
tara:strand:+ start:9092 stop:9352 length:261 start_codon:yes stop_codon:yes gene_type:complete